MIEDDFYATVKFKSGEEIFAKVAASEEYERTILIISNPVVINEIKGKIGTVGYKIEPWLKTTSEDMFIVDIKDILTLSESSDIEMILTYQSYMRQSEKSSKNESKISKNMGYVTNINDAKELLEKIFKLNMDLHD
jgi:hypothetical protein